MNFPSYVLKLVTLLLETRILLRCNALIKTANQNNIQTVMKDIMHLIIKFTRSI